LLSGLDFFFSRVEINTSCRSYCDTQFGFIGFAQFTHFGILLCSGEVSTLFGASGGAGTFGFGAPTGSSFVGIRLFFQGASLDGTAPGGVAVTNGVSAMLGT
jgi:hypothetical protein